LDQPLLNGAPKNANVPEVDETLFTRVNVLWGILIIFVLWLIYWMIDKGFNLSKTIDNTSVAIGDAMRLGL
jgi:hypothetical protein